MARKKMSAANKRTVGDVMRAARKRRPTGRKVKFTKDEKSTLRHVMQDHSGSGRRKAATKKTRGASKSRTAKRGRKAGFKHSAATRKKMSAAHKKRHAGKRRAVDKKRGYGFTPKRKYVRSVH